MKVKFPNGGAGYGLGYVPGEVADLGKKINARILTTLIDANGNPRGQEWRDHELDLDELIEKGVCVAVQEEKKK